ncbi:MAG: methyltransferase domain-containing protein [Marinicellaceae bacterium]
MKTDDLKLLNIGAGKTYIPNMINIDISSNAEITLDLSKEALPFEDNSIDLIFSYHTLEHIPNYLFALSEIYRVLKPNAILLIGVPYVTLSEYNLVNPYHLHNFSEHSFDFFDSKKLKGSAKESNQILFHKVFHRFHYIGKFKSLPGFLKRWCRRHLFNVVKKIDFGLIAVKNDDAIPSEISAEYLISRFDKLFQSRTRY